jgi:CheY-like chemotaxis protein
MPLILAIEPDKRQASQLTAIVRSRLHAELVLADSADRALAALGDRVPDLVLTSALLSPKDESMLSDRLRALDGHAAHVQTLTIPVLATHSSHGGGRASGVLAALRREKSRSAGQGCDPAIFAEQCKDYLDRGAVERAASLERAATAPTVKEPARPISPSPVTGSEWVVVHEDDPPEPAQTTSFGPVDDETAIADQDLSMRVAETVDAAVLPVEVVIPDSEDATETPHVDRALKEFLDLPPTSSQGPASLLAAVAALEAEEQNYLTTRPPEPAPVPVSEELTGESEPAETIRPGFGDTVAEPELRHEPAFAEAFTFVQAPSQMTDGNAEADSSFADTLATDAHEIDAGRVGGDFESNPPSSQSVGEPPLALSDLGEILRNAPEFAAPQPVKSEPPRSAPQTQPEDLKEWFEIVEALRRDAEQLDARRATSVADDALEKLAAEHTAEAAPEHLDVAPPTRTAAEDPDRAAETIGLPPTPSESVTTVDAGPETSAAYRAVSEVALQEAAPVGVPEPTPKRKRRRTKNNPAQDEWGFFDPDQCGFAALIEKLEEITEKDEKPAPRGA